MDFGSAEPMEGMDTSDSSANSPKIPPSPSAPAQSAVVTIGDGKSSGSTPAFTLRIGDIVATAPIINFPPSTNLPKEDDGVSLVRSGARLSTSPAGTSSSRGTRNPMIDYVIGSPVNRASPTFGHETYSTINTDFVGAAASVPPIEPPEFTLSNLLEQLEDYTPSLPDPIANHFLNMAGFDSPDPRISRLVTLAASKFIYDLLKGSSTICKAKAAAAAAARGKPLAKDTKYVLNFENLAQAAEEYKIALQKSPPPSEWSD